MSHVPLSQSAEFFVSIITKMIRAVNSKICKIKPDIYINLIKTTLGNSHRLPIDDAKACDVQEKAGSDDALSEALRADILMKWRK